MDAFASDTSTQCLESRGRKQAAIIERKQLNWRGLWINMEKDGRKGVGVGGEREPRRKKFDGKGLKMRSYS